MQLLQNYDSDLCDSKSTVNFINRVDSLIEVMMSREPSKALKLNTPCHTVIFVMVIYVIYLLKNVYVNNVINITLDLR